MTKERLGQLSWLKLEIEELTKRIRRIENLLAGKTNRIDGMPWVGTQSDIIKELAPQLTALQEQLAQSRSIAMEEFNRLQTFIHNIDDSQIRLLFTLRYMDGLSWHQVAWRLGGNTADSARMMHNRFLTRLNESDSPLIPDESLRK